MARYLPVATVLLAAATAAAPPDSKERTPSSGPFAMGGPELSAALGPLRTAVGSWAEYLVRANGEEGVRMRLSVVPPALDGGRAWLELTVLGEHALPFAARLLLDGKGGIEQAIVYALGQAPLEIPLGDSQPLTAESMGALGMRATHVGAAEVTVPAGTFRAEELRVVSGRGTTRVWRAAQVPLWGLVRAEGPSGLVELIGMGEKGARSVFPDDHGKGSESAK